MAQMFVADDCNSMGIEMVDTGRNLPSMFPSDALSFTRSSATSSPKDDKDDAETEDAPQYWAKVERLPASDRLRLSVRDREIGGGVVDERLETLADVTKLGAKERQEFIQKLIRHVENDNRTMLRKIRSRIDTVGMKLPTIEVRYKDLRVEARCEVIDGKPLPTLWNAFKGIFQGFARLTGLKSHEAKISILNNVSGILKPGRMTLLLGPPGCGKSALLKALSGSLDESLKISGEITFNGHGLEEFVPQKSCAYVSQFDQHISEMTVRETLEFSAGCQGVGSRADIMMEISRREKEARIIPDPDIDLYMKAISIKGLKRSLQTDYILKVLGLDICSDIRVGDAMRRGISGGQKKRLTTGEMIVGPARALFMDEITNGLDSSTAFQIVSSLQQLAHITDTTILVSLLQPDPETYGLFDDLILMAEGKIVYHGPREKVLEFFQDCGFKCPERKNAADFLQEVFSRKDQAQYWYHTNILHSYVSVNTFYKKFRDSSLGKKLEEDLSEPYDRSQSQEGALSFSTYSVSNWQLLKACMSREVLLMRRNSYLHISKTFQLIVIAAITMTMFMGSEMNIDVVDANSYMGALFFALVMLLVDGFPEVAFTVQRLAIFYKQKQLHFYPAWCYAIPAIILKVPLSLFKSLVWTCLTYYVIGYSPEASRFFRQFLILFSLHLTSLSLFGFLASVFRTLVASLTASSFVTLFGFLFSGFIIPKPAMPDWLKWSFWFCPLSYGEIGLSVNEFLAPRWQKKSSTNATIGQATLVSRGLHFEGYFYWVSMAALLGFILLFNIGFTLALSFLKPLSLARAIISKEKLSQMQRSHDTHDSSHVEGKLRDSSTTENGRTVLPFQPLKIAFHGLNYSVDTPAELKERGFSAERLQLLSGVSGCFRPGVLTALMGASGAGKTTLLDVLSGRKTTGYIEGEIKVGGYPKVQQTFARISGYCEQADVHSPNITVEESVMFSAWLRLPPEIDSRTKADFVKDVLETIELEEIKDALVGIPGFSGLSTEQRKRLTIAVEFVANPSIIFMDEPTTGLDARAAAIVVRAVKSISDTGRTIVCTIHQPSLDIFEAFDELILLKKGGRMIYSGELGECSKRMIEYFEGIPGVPKMTYNRNPATWMLEVTSKSAEAQMGLDFAQIFKESYLYRDNQERVKQFCSPPPGSIDLHFPRPFAQSGWGQFKQCLWKLQLSYWRSPSYNLKRIMTTFVTSLILGGLFWDQGQKILDQQNLFNVFGAMYVAALLLGIGNCSPTGRHVETERNVMYRERFAGMYSPWAYAFAQVVIEIPYLFIQAAEFTIITYPMIGYYRSVHKVCWYFYVMFCNLLYYNYLGMLMVSVTPNSMVAMIPQSLCYTLLNLFSGFLIPRSRIPKWWIWLYYLTPTSWMVKGFLSSQYGDIDKEVRVFGETKTVAKFLQDYYGFHHEQLPLTALFLALFPVVFALLFGFFVGQLNFQHR